ncbi:MAG: hypothetical protein LBV38_02260 [Alistipes sp.]|jgi:hypothetical protein|nr:hypothetical protein [Alistipes sp.]
MLKWFRGLAPQEKWMVALIAMLILGIVVRWAWVSGEIVEAVRDQFSAPTPNEK